jgi:hypothetical protein
MGSAMRGDLHDQHGEATPLACGIGLECNLLGDPAVGPPTGGQSRLSLMETAPMSTNATLDAADPARRHLDQASLWAALLAAHRSASARSQKLGRAYAAAEEATFAAKRDRRLVPAPVELVAGKRLPVVLMIDGKNRTLPGAETVLATEQAIRVYCARTGGPLSGKLSALARWRAAQESADAASGYAAAVAIEDAANEAWIEAQNEADRALHAVLCFPTAAADKVAAKRALLDDNPCIDQVVELRMIVDAVLAARRRA